MRITHLRRYLAGTLLLLAAGTSPALTLGRAQGVALLGRPLDMSVAVGLDPATDAGDLCAGIEVFYGDGRVEPRRVDLRITPSGEGAVARVRVATPVDEAFVTVLLRVGCQQRLSRRYVLLSEQPGDLVEAAATPAPVAPQAAASPAARVGPAAGGNAAAAPAANPAAGAPLPSVGPAEPAASVGGTSQPAARPKPARRAPAAVAPADRAGSPATTQPRSRLKLDAVESRATSPAPAAAPAAAPAVAATPAPGAAPQPPIAPASSVPSDEAVRNAERLQSLESELRAMREAMQRNSVAMNDLRGRLERAEGERYANALVYTLAGLLLAVGGLAGFLWWRGRGQGLSTRDWWLDTPSRVMSHPPASPVPAQGDEATTMRGEPAARAAAEPDRASLQFDAINPPSVAPAPSGEGLRVSDPAPLSSDELSDIQQEADFFMSLGEYDRAIEVLRNHIEAHPQASAVAWLDLLEIHHKLGRREEYEQLRRDFEWLFNARLPGFDQFDQGQQGLETHAALLENIVRLWPGREVLELIDTAIFRRPVDEQGEALGLQAYRDLLFLHHVATEILSGEPARPLVQAAGLKPAIPKPAGPAVDPFASGSVDDGFPVPGIEAFAASTVADPFEARLTEGVEPEPQADVPVLDINLDELESLPADHDAHRLLDFDVGEDDRYGLPSREGRNKG